MTESHDVWIRQIDAELDGELSLIERAALAKHLTTCAHCAGARASQLEVRVALARSAGNAHARVVPRPAIRGRALTFWVVLGVVAGAAAGWLAYGRWGGPGGGSLEDARAAVVVR
ncbi:MAG TPA: zf-HC2 domain-containing protein [Gemmatimonadales bacterium]|jgi:anti-sigma factor RsiW|nr:zf-HC2 domain-containing protein [Gemmatimonadales bacterium]